MKISENTSISMPMKNMLAIIAGVAMGVFAYTEVTSAQEVRTKAHGPRTVYVNRIFVWRCRKIN